MATLIKGKNANKPHTVRYWADGRQREKSFATLTEARDFKAKAEHDTRAGTFTDPKLSTVSFADYAATVIDGYSATPGTLKAYRGLLKVWINPYAAGRSLAKVANDREGFAKLLNVTMRHLSEERRVSARTVMLAVVNEALNGGRIANHKLSGIKLQKDNVVSDEHKGFVFPSFGQVNQLASDLNGYGIAVWLMRGCGLRVREALAVRKSDFIDGGRTLRITGQASISGDRKEVLKHRANGGGRDIPVPAWLWAKVASLPDGVLAKPHNSTGNPYLSYSVVYKRFMLVSKILGISEDFTPHSLRHAYATALLTRGVGIAAVSKWLGHSDVAITSKIYYHVMPSSLDQARSVLDSEFSEWSGE